MTQTQQWSTGLHQRIAAAIRSAREGRIEGRMAAQELADETARLGYPVSRSQIANYESGRKQGLDVAELLILAVALDIPPALLLFPAFPDGKVELIPGRMVDTNRAVAWLSGASTMEVGSSTVGTELVGAVADRASLDDELVRLRGMLPRIDAKPVVIESTQRVIRNCEERLAAAQARIDATKVALWGDSDGPADE